MMQKTRFLFATIILLISCLSGGVLAKTSVKDQKKPANSIQKTTSELVTAVNQYKASVTALIPVYESALKSAKEAYEKRKELFDQGIISKRDLEAGEQGIKEAQARLDESRKQLSESDELVAEAMTERQALLHPKIVVPSGKSGSYSATSAIIRSGGSAGWTLAQSSMVQNFFSSTFGRTLPVSAFGQSGTHNRMGFDHRNSMDVAVHPDSAEGRALITYLRTNGIPFLAFRSAVPGAATGAHIHVGYPSHRI